MNRKKFLKKLARLLRRLPQEEKEAALRYYREYFDEAGPENEQRIIGELGSPEKVAAEVLAGSSSPETAAGSTQNEKPRRGIGLVWTVILSILAAPIALPLAILAICLVIAIAVVMIALVVAFFAAMIAVIFSGMVLLFGFPGVFFANFGLGLISTGAYLFAVAVCILLFALSVALTSLVFRGLAALFRAGRKKEHE